MNKVRTHPPTKNMKQDLKNIKEWCAVNFRDEYKTAIDGDIPYTYKIVTRVNCITTRLWLDIKFAPFRGKKGMPELAMKPNWLTIDSKYKRKTDIKIAEYNSVNNSYIP